MKNKLTPQEIFQKASSGGDITPEEREVLRRTLATPNQSDSLNGNEKIKDSKENKARYGYKIDTSLGGYVPNVEVQDSLPKGKSGIYIKPENRGKFNATKKATGKTTEELTHSKNSVTRKRAIFSQNAAKWKHQNGGVIPKDSTMSSDSQVSYQNSNKDEFQVGGYMGVYKTRNGKQPEMIKHKKKLPTTKLMQFGGSTNKSADSQLSYENLKYDTTRPGYRGKTISADSVVSYQNGSQEYNNKGSIPNLQSGDYINGGREDNWYMPRKLFLANHQQGGKVISEDDVVGYPKAQVGLNVDNIKLQPIKTVDPGVLYSDDYSNGVSPTVMPYNYDKGTIAENAWQVQQKVFPGAVKDSNRWYESWYAGRMKLPEFQKVASDRYDAVTDKKIPIILETSPDNVKGGRNNSLGTTYREVVSPENEKNRNKIFINNAMAPDMEYNKNYNRQFENPKTSRNYLKNEIIHETSHWLENNYPQQNTDRDVIKHKYNNKVYDQILNDVLPKEYLIPSGKDDQKDIYDINSNGLPDYLHHYVSKPTEIRARLDRWREFNKIDPTKKYSEEEINDIINKNIKYINDDKSDSHDNIRELYKLLHKNPKVLQQLNEKLVSNNKSNNIPTAQKGKNLVNIDGKMIDTNSPEYRKMYNQGQIASVDSEGIPTVYQGSDAAWDEYYENQRKNKGANAVRQGRAKFAQPFYDYSGINEVANFVKDPKAHINSIYNIMSTVGSLGMMPEGTYHTPEDEERLMNTIGTVGLVAPVMSPARYLKNPIPRSSNLKNIISLGEELIRQPFVNNANKQINKGNTWLKNWIKDPVTQRKIVDSYKDGTSPNQYVDLDRLSYPQSNSRINNVPVNNNQTKLNYISTQSLVPDDKSNWYERPGSSYKNLESDADNYINSINKNKEVQFLRKYTPNSKLYPIDKQIGDFVNDVNNIHDTNLGVSYLHGFSPEDKMQIMNGKKPSDFYNMDDSRYGSWISRKGNKKASTTIHEGTHDWVDHETIRTSGQDDIIYDNISHDLPRTKKYDYLSDPTEVHARIMELRYHYGLKPSDKVDADFAQKILDDIKSKKTPIDSKFGKVLENSKNTSNLFNKLWLGTGAVATGAALNQEQPKRQAGGHVALSYPDHNTGMSADSTNDYNVIRREYNNYQKGGYTVRRSNERKGKTHVVTGPDGTKKYFGDPNMGERGDSKHGKDAFYARHATNLKNNPYFRAYARSTWEDGGEIIQYKEGGQKDSTINCDNCGWSWKMSDAGSDALTCHKCGSTNNKIEMKNGGQMIKRADGSYSKRGLWDNIRANRGSGKEPTKEMLEQERKIKQQMAYGGLIKAQVGLNHNPMLFQEPGHGVKAPIVEYPQMKPVYSTQDQSTRPNQFTHVGQDKPYLGYQEATPFNNTFLWNAMEFADPTGIASYPDVYQAWSDGKFDYHDIIEPLSALPGVGYFGKFSKPVKAINLKKNGMGNIVYTKPGVGSLMKVPIAADRFDTVDDVYNDNIKPILKNTEGFGPGDVKKKQGGNITCHKCGGSINMQTGGRACGCRHMRKKQDGGELDYRMRDYKQNMYNRQARQFVTPYIEQNTNKDFVRRIIEPNSVKPILYPNGDYATHKMLSVDQSAMPLIRNENGKLIDYDGNLDIQVDAINKNYNDGEFVDLPNERLANKFATDYKSFRNEDVPTPTHFKYKQGGKLPCHKCGGVHKPYQMCYGGMVKDHMGMMNHNGQSIEDFEVIDEQDVLAPNDSNRFATKTNNKPIGFKYSMMKINRM